MDTTCLETRRALTSDPNSRDTKVLKHLSTCERCTNFLQGIKRFDSKLTSALKIDVPEGLESRIILAQRMRADENDSLPNNVTSIHEKSGKRNGYRWMSLAAAIVLAVGLSLGIFRLGQSHGIQEEVLAHVYEDQYALEIDNNVSLVSLNSLLEPHGLQARGSIGHIRYASNCPLENKMAPHFVLDESGVPVTVMYIPWEHTSKRLAINDKRFKGILFSNKKGSYVILSEDPNMVGSVETRVMKSIETRI